MLSDGGAAGLPLDDPGSLEARGVLAWGPSDVMNPESLGVAAVGVAIAGTRGGVCDWVSGIKEVGLSLGGRKSAACWGLRPQTVMNGEGEVDEGLGCNGGGRGVSVLVVVVGCKQKTAPAANRGAGTKHWPTPSIKREKTRDLGSDAAGEREEVGLTLMDPLFRCCALCE